MLRMESIKLIVKIIIEMSETMRAAMSHMNMLIREKRVTETQERVSADNMPWNVFTCSIAVFLGRCT